MDWVDAAGNTNWADFEASPMKAIECKTVGWVHKKMGNALCLYSERTEEMAIRNSTIGSRHTLPKSCIRKVTVIQKGA